MTMWRPSISTILSFAFCFYIVHSMWMMAQLFITIKCTDVPCYESYLMLKPQLQLAIFTSVSSNPISSEVKRIHIVENFDYWNEYKRELKIDVPLRTRRNGTLYMHVVLAEKGEYLEWNSLRRDGLTVIHTQCLTNYMEPRAETFNLLGEGKESVANQANNAASTKFPRIKPVTHIMSNIHIGLLIDKISVSRQDVPAELVPLIRVNQHYQIMPILITDSLSQRLKDLVQVTKNTTEFNVQFIYRPISIGKLRLILMTAHSWRMIEPYGFSNKDFDEVKGLFSETNMYLLCVTVLIAGVHMLFDFLSFKNDVSFWRRKTSYEGLSTRTTLWRAFSQIIILLYLVDEGTTLLVVIPAGIATLIELWKCKKILRVKIGLTEWRRIGLNNEASTSATGLAERKTEELDKEGMKYLSYLLYPLILAGAVYTLIYQPHKSWYSWTLQSLVNGVYAFGFLFMLPQLFINYKLKSVAALPCRAFMYKAFNTFIDDFFAFIITMPTAHRVACLRDDVVFIIYLYQRWLYPVDNNRVDSTALVINETDNKKDN